MPVNGGDPGQAEAHYRIGVTHQQAAVYDQAAAAYRRVIALAPDHAGAHLGLGIALRKLGEPAAVDVLRRAIQLSPGDPDGYGNLASALQEHGDPAAAREACSRLLAMRPTNVYAWALHVGLTTFAAGDPDLERMEALAARITGKDEDERRKESILRFALGRAWMEVGEADRAFGHLSRANRLKRSTFDYDVRAQARRLAAIPGAIGNLRQRLSGPGHPSQAPVFVVGLPRSGSTLVEQILASHPEIHGRGELTAFPEATAEAFREAGPAPRGGQMGRVGFDSLSRLDLARLGGAYLDRVAPLAGGKARLVDKLPSNFQNLGLISLALPNARIIHCRRDPLDTCLSCYATHFDAGQLFTYDLVELGQYYRAYAALMDHWRASLPPGRFLDVRYEDVLADLEGEARRLVAFLDLRWDAACLRFHENRRPVRTASVNQVRRPLNAAGRGRWRAYEAHLGPLSEALQGRGEPSGAHAT